MKLITELNQEIKVIEEETDGEKNMFIEGIFLQAEIKNKNGRVYPVAVLEREAERYSEKYISEKRAFGELGHPEGPVINLDRVSHTITSLKKDGNDFVGKAKIMGSTPMGKIAESLLKEGCRLGVSSRGMGSLKDVNGENIVQDDFFLATAADIVADPSAPNAFVQGIMEDREWVWDNGILKEGDVQDYKYNIEKIVKTYKYNKRDRQADFVKAFESYIKDLNINIGERI